MTFEMILAYSYIASNTNALCLSFTFNHTTLTTRIFSILEFIYTRFMGMVVGKACRTVVLLTSLAVICCLFPTKFFMCAMLSLLLIKGLILNQFANNYIFLLIMLIRNLLRWLYSFSLSQFANQLSYNFLAKI